MAWESASLRVCFRLPTGLSCFSRSTSVSRPQVPLAHGPRHRQPHVATSLLTHPPALPVILRAQLNITFSRSFSNPRSGLPASHECPLRLQPWPLRSAGSSLVYVPTTPSSRRGPVPASLVPGQNPRHRGIPGPTAICPVTTYRPVGPRLSGNLASGCERGSWSHFCVL